MASKTILILGASYGGISAAHYFLKHIYPVLPEKATYNVVLVDASSKLFGRPAAPRAVVSHKLMPAEKIFLDIASGFKSYPADQFTFLQATATSSSIDDKTVTVTLPSGETQMIAYYALIIATGTRTPSPLLGLHGDYKLSEETQSAFIAALPNAKSILIAGGGPAGVETAGEIAEQLNGVAGMFSSKLANPKVKITLVTSGSKLLPILRPAIASQAQTLLEKMGVEVVYNTKVESVTPEGTGTLDTTTASTQAASIKLSNGETKEVDLYIAATGVTPNTSFLPTNLLNEKGYVENNKITMRVDAAGPFVYALGDVATYTIGGIMDLISAVPVVMTNIKRDLLAPAGEKPAGKDMPYKAQNLKETHLVPVGRSKGVGAIFGFKIPSLMVYMIKGKDYFVSDLPNYLNGSKWTKETKWDAVS